MLFALLGLGLFLTVPKYSLLFDAPEYVEIAVENNFLESIGLGHIPIHPTFNALNWIVVRMFTSFGITPAYAGNLSSLVFGISSIIIFYFLSGYYLKGIQRYLSVFLFALFPMFWILSTNANVEILTLLFFMITLLIRVSTRKTVRYDLLFILSVSLMLTTHIISLTWLPFIIFMPALFGQAEDNSSQETLRSVKITLVAVAISLYAYYLVFSLSGKNGVDEILRMFIKTNDVYDFNLVGLGRVLRNTVLSLMRGLGNVTAILFLAVVILRLLKTKSRSSYLVLLIFAFSIVLSSGAWTGDFMLKRAIFVLPLAALLLVRQFKSYTLVLMFYLAPIIIANGLLNINADSHPVVEMQKMHETLSSGDVLIQSIYMQPFTHHGGEVLSLEATNSEIIDEYLSKGKEVYMDSQALFSPYLLYTGNNLHVTSLGKFGVSDSKVFYDDFVFDIETVGDAKKRVFLLSVKREGEDYAVRWRQNRASVDGGDTLIMGLSEPGQAVLIYSDKFKDRIRRERLDYGDVITWAWVLVTDRREPVGWTYADKDGVFVYPYPGTNNFLLEL